jgi:hypothetical protein
VEIRLKNGMPLMVGGQVAGSQTCCCENPPPPLCICSPSDRCSYFIEVVSPAAAALKSPVANCGPTNEFNAFRSVSGYPFIDGKLPAATYPADITLSGVNRAAASSFGFLSAGIEIKQALAKFVGSYEYIDAFWGASAFLQCDSNIDGGNPARQKLTIGFSVAASTYDSVNGTSYYSFGFTVDHFPEYDCLEPGNRMCGDVTPFRYSFVKTPLEFSVDGDGTSFGAASSPATYSAGHPATIDTLRDIVDSIRDDVTATFRITSRDNCEPVVDCDCESNTDGLKILFNEPPFFSYFLFDGDTELQTSSDLGAYYTLFYQPSANDWVITYEQNNPSNTELYYRITARIFCEAVPGGVPSPFRWYYSLESECFEWEDGSITKNTKETWVGHFNCEEDPCGTNGRAAGDLYPVGLPRDVVSLGRTTPEGYAACNPSGGITELLIINDAECP